MRDYLSKFLVTSAMALFLASCGDNGKGEGLTQSVTKDGMAKMAIKSSRIDSECFYHGKKPTLPSKIKPTIRIIAFELKDGAQPVRLQLNEDSDTHRALFGESGILELFSVNPSEFPRMRQSLPSNYPLNYSRSSDRNATQSAVQRLLANAPRSDFNVAVPAEVSSGVNPLTVDMYYFTQAFFVILNDKTVFDEKAPHRVMVGETSNIAPYYGPSRRSQNGRVISFDYYSDPELIKPRTCRYDYELSLIVQGDGYSIPIIIDPGEWGDGSPPPPGHQN